MVILGDFSSFWVKTSIFGGVSRAELVGAGAVESKEVEDGIGDEKMGIFGENSLVERIFVFFGHF